MCQIRIYISQINDFCINISNGKREVTRINVAMLLFLCDKMHNDLSLFYLHKTYLIDIIQMYHFRTEIERDRKQYSFLSIGHIHTGKEGGGWGVLASRSISVRIGLKSGRKVFEILLQTVYSDVLKVEAYRSCCYFISKEAINHFNERRGIFPPIFNSFFCRTFGQIVFIHRWQFSLNHDGWDKKNPHIRFMILKERYLLKR